MQCSKLLPKNVSLLLFKKYFDRWLLILSRLTNSNSFFLPGFFPFPPPHYSHFSCIAPRIRVNSLWTIYLKFSLNLISQTNCERNRCACVSKLEQHSRIMERTIDANSTRFLRFQNALFYSGARGAPWVSKFGNPLIRKILVLRQRTSVRTDSGGGWGNAIFSCSWSKQYGGWFLVRSIFNTIIVIYSWNEDL